MFTLDSVYSSTMLAAIAAPRSDIYYRKHKSTRRMAAPKNIWLVHGASRFENFKISGDCDAFENYEEMVRECAKK